MDTTIHILSDIHLELLPKKTCHVTTIVENLPSCEVLVLAGDIGNPFDKNYREFMEYVSQKFKLVIVIAGNHEYYTSKLTMFEIEEQISRVISEFFNIVFLQQDTFVYKNIKFFGCTLWSSIPPKKLTNDFYKIVDMTPEKYNTIHNDHKRWLYSELINTPSEFKKVVITHHLPSFDLLSSFDVGLDGDVVYFYSSTIDYIDLVDVWLCGHYHKPCRVTIKNCDCYINPVGYIGQRTDYNRSLIIEL
jgi:predicted phosphodiesterase